MMTSVRRNCRRPGWGPTPSPASSSIGRTTVGTFAPAAMSRSSSVGGKSTCLPAFEPVWTSTVRAGLAVWIDPRHSLRLECTPERIVAVAYVGDLRSVLGDFATPTGESIDLEIRMTPALGSAYSTSRGPDRVEVGLNQQGTFMALGGLDGRYLSTEVAGGMTGRMIGAFCSSGQIVLRSFDYAGSDDPIACSAMARATVIATITSGEDQGPGGWSKDLLDA